LFFTSSTRITFLFTTVFDEMRCHLFTTKINIKKYNKGLYKALIHL